MNTILVIAAVIAVVGYVAYKYPTWFGKSVQSGADFVNKEINDAKAAAAPVVDKATQAVKDQVNKVI